MTLETATMLFNAFGTWAAEAGLHSPKQVQDEGTALMKTLEAPAIVGRGKVKYPGLKLATVVMDWLTLAFDGVTPETADEDDGPVLMERGIVLSRLMATGCLNGDAVEAVMESNAAAVA